MNETVRDIVEEICEFECKKCAAYPHGSDRCIKILNEYVERIKKAAEEGRYGDVQTKR